MRTKRSLFLLEVVIAIALVGIFSAYFLRSSLHHAYKERQRLLDLAFEWPADLFKMEVLTNGWSLEKSSSIEKSTIVKLGQREYSRSYLYNLSRTQENEKGYRLTLVEKEKDGKSKTYNFFARK